MDKNFVLEKLAIKKELDSSFFAKGAYKHRYRLKPPIKKQELDEVESRFGISLPEDYRNFILEVGNGGAGPEHGLNTLQEALSRYRTDSNGKTHRYDVGDEVAKNFIRYDEISDIPDDTYPHPSDDCGRITLGSVRNYLVINGKEKGYMYEESEWFGFLMPSLKQPNYFKNIIATCQNKK